MIEVWSSYVFWYRSPYPTSLSEDSSGHKPSGTWLAARYAAPLWRDEVARRRLTRYNGWEPLGHKAVKPMAMKNILAAALLLVYTVSSGGIVLIEYSCHETGTSGVATPAPRSCYAPECEDEAPVAPDACCDHACCEIDVRVNAPGDQISGSPTDPGDAATTDASADATISLSDASVTETAAAVTSTPPFPGHTRPIRI